jgi:ubiquinone/menaquinone biosynthesis C-methylase UbiE
MFNLQHLNELRTAETSKIIEYLKPGTRILEVGAGTGNQAREIANQGFQVEAVEIASSHNSSSQYVAARVFPIVEYDGRHFPFPDQSFDSVISSNVLEHVPDLMQMHSEIRRVIKPGGYAVHVLPTHVWRLWTSISCIPTLFQYANALKREMSPRRPFDAAELRRLARVWSYLGQYIRESMSRHGERGNVISELRYFHPSWWRSNFRENGFEIIRDEPMGLFYTGNMTFGPSWPMDKRRRLAKALGSACHIFQIRPLV